MHFLIALVFALSPHHAPLHTHVQCLHYQGKTFCHTRIDFRQLQRPALHPVKPIEHNPPRRAVTIPIPRVTY